jgi:radical SAM protein with 4Fe4S-binding SPASM domain
VKSPHLVDWAITDKCNLNCEHCRGFPQGHVSNERARELIEEIEVLKPDWVLIEGGEPLLREDIFDLLGLMRQKQLDVHLISNGMLLNPQLLERIQQLGVKLMISIDGARPETYEVLRTGASFSHVIEVIRQAVSMGMLEAINFTMIKQNYEEIPALFDLAASLGVPSITLIGLKPCSDYEAKLLSPEEYRKAIKLTYDSSQKTGISFFFDEPFFWVIIKELGLPLQMPSSGTGIVDPSTSACIFGEYLFIDTNGDVKPCSFPMMTLGNVNEESLVEIWSDVVTGDFFKRIRDPESRTGKCGDCQYLVECKGGRSRTYFLTGDWFATDPICPLNLTISSGGNRL